ncbi:hypothetical protein H5410_063994 [Solanum commersonii]|uniref:Uncharacterized protein n=1 Tax=Solanum commersonii TaxID=4109 RepID=A0A9J5W1D4_SOLCO|nr:hypothetical protein H5410_063994 [Solanum commersonii]
MVVTGDGELGFDSEREPEKRLPHPRKAAAPRNYPIPTREDFGPITLAFWIGVMINRTVGAFRFHSRGEILGFMKDEQPRKHLPRMFSLIKNESRGSRRIDTALVSTINDAALWIGGCCF